MWLSTVFCSIRPKCSTSEANPVMTHTCPFEKESHEGAKWTKWLSLTGFTLKPSKSIEWSWFDGDGFHVFDEGERRKMRTLSCSGYLFTRQLLWAHEAVNDPSQFLIGEEELSVVMQKTWEIKKLISKRKLVVIVDIKVKKWDYNNDNLSIDPIDDRPYFLLSFRPSVVPFVPQIYTNFECVPVGFLESAHSCACARLCRSVAWRCDVSVFVTFFSLKEWTTKQLQLICHFIIGLS